LRDIIAWMIRKVPLAIFDNTKQFKDLKQFQEELDIFLYIFVLVTYSPRYIDAHFHIFEIITK